MSSSHRLPLCPLPEATLMSHCKRAGIGGDEEKRAERQGSEIALLSARHFRVIDPAARRQTDDNQSTKRDDKNTSIV